MLRRLFFLFPDENHAQKVVDHLAEVDVTERYIHAIAHGVELKTLPEATDRQKNDTTFKVENILWHLNLLIFIIAVLALVPSFFVSGVMVITSLGVMLVAFIMGQQFVVKVPDVHLTEFTDALSHGEVLLMVDVPSRRVSEIEDFIHHKYPEAVVGGVGWSLDAFGM